MTLYVQEENYHFDGYISGVIVDEENNRVALYYQEGIQEEKDITLSDARTKWYELDKVSVEGNKITIKAKNLAIYKNFTALNIIKTI